VGKCTHVFVWEVVTWRRPHIDSPQAPPPKFSGEAVMKSSIVKRSVVIDRHKTSISLEDSFWTDLKEIAHYQRIPVSKLLENIDNERGGNLSSAIRLFVLDQVRRHGDFWQYSRDRR